jgi:hypothetical protein
MLYAKEERASLAVDRDAKVRRDLAADADVDLAAVPEAEEGLVAEREADHPQNCEIRLEIQLKE